MLPLSVSLLIGFMPVLHMSVVPVHDLYNMSTTFVYDFVAEF